MSKKDNLFIEAKYKITGHLYDILDYPWEKHFYHKMRPQLLHDLSGEVIEAGIGTGRNLKYYPKDVTLTGIDLSKVMLKKAIKRNKKAAVKATFLKANACDMPLIESNKFDFYISTFMYCVMPDPLQPQAIAEMARVLKPGGQFRLVEMVYSKQPRLLRRQKLMEKFVEKIYGARFDRHTQTYIEENPKLEITNLKFLKEDTYLLIEGRRP